MQNMHNMENMKNMQNCKKGFSAAGGGGRQLGGNSRRAAAGGGTRQSWDHFFPKTYFKREATPKIFKDLFYKGGHKQIQRLILKGRPLGGGRRRAARYANPGRECYLTTNEVRTPQCKHCLGKYIYNYFYIIY